MPNILNQLGTDRRNNEPVFVDVDKLREISLHSSSPIKTKLGEVQCEEIDNGCYKLTLTDPQKIIDATIKALKDGESQLSLDYFRLLPIRNKR